MNSLTKLVSNIKLKPILSISVYVFLMIIAAVIFTKYVNRDSLQIIVQRSGSLGIIVYLLIEIIYVTLTPLLNTAILITSGFIFGGHIGFVVNFLATTVGLFMIIILIKRYGRPLLKRLISKKSYRFFDHITQKVGPITLLIVYILPFTPDDEITYIVAAGPIGFKRFVLPVLLGTVAKSAYSYIGDMGTRGIVIATYTRLTLLVLGLLIVGIQEYLYFKKSS